MDLMTTVESTRRDKSVPRMERSNHRARSVIDSLDGCPLAGLVECLLRGNQYLVTDAIVNFFLLL